MMAQLCHGTPKALVSDDEDRGDKGAENNSGTVVPVELSAVALAFIESTSRFRASV